MHVIRNPYSPATKVVAPQGSQYRADYYTDGTDDNIQINAAITDVNAAGGGSVKLKAGLYNISATISMKSNVILEGEGNTATIIKKANNASSLNAVNCTSISDFQIRDLKIDGNKTNNATGRGLSMNSASKGIISRVYVVDAVEGIFNTTCTDLLIENCIADGNYEWNFYTYAGTRIKLCFNRSLNAKAGSFEGFGMAFYNNNTHCEAVSNYIYNSAHNGLQLNAGSASADVVGIIFRDNHVENAGNRGIFVTDDNNATYHVKRASIIGNRAVGAVDQGIYIINTYDTLIEGNKASASSQSGIMLEKCQNCIVKDNNSLSNTKYGINLQGVTNSIISGNSCNSNGFKGIILQQQSAIQSTNNVVIGNQTNGNTQGGIWTLNTSDSNIFLGNNVANNTTANMSIVAGAATIIRNNIGYITENSGTATINSGSTSVTVNHGLSVTPTLKDISVVLGENPTNDPGSIWISNITSSQFTVNVRNDPGASNLDLAWRCVVL